MAEKTGNILQSLIPLILIVLVSWFFSFLGSKAKKASDKMGKPQEKETEKNALDLILDMDDTKEPVRQEQQPFKPPVTGSWKPAQAWQPSAAGPEVTPKPIEPKWWGA